MNFLKKWAIKQLTEVSAWVAVLVMVCSIFHFSYTIFFVIGLLLLLADEEQIKNFINEVAPSLSKKINGDK